MAIQQDRDSSLRAEIVALQRRVQVLEAEAVENERIDYYCVKNTRSEKG